MNQKKNSYHVFFTNLANPLKISILLSLKDGEKNVGKIARELKVEQSKLSHALSALRCCNIVQSNQKGKERIYFLNSQNIPKILELTDRHARTFCKKPGCNCDAKTIK